MCFSCRLITCLYDLSSVLCCPVRLPPKNDLLYIEDHVFFVIYIDLRILVPDTIFVWDYITVTWRLPLVEQELLTLLGFSEVRGAKYLVYCECFVDYCLFFPWSLHCLSFYLQPLITLRYLDHCIVYPSIYSL